MTGPISNHPGLPDGKPATATGNKANGQKSGQSSAAAAGSSGSSDQVSLSSAGLQLTGQSRQGAIATTEEAFAIAVRIKSLFSEHGTGALAAHGGKISADLKGLLQPA